MTSPGPCKFCGQPVPADPVRRFCKPGSPVFCRTKEWPLPSKGTPFPEDDPRMQDLNDDSPQDEGDV